MVMNGILSTVGFWLLMCPVPRLGCDLPSSEFTPYLYPSMTNQRLSLWLTGA